MPTIDKHQPGSFCWIELGTSDQNAAKQFYSSLFGWAVNDIPMGPGASYTMFELNGRNAAAAYTLRPGQQAEGVPPHWMLYMSVDSADDSAKQAGELGGTVVVPPFDVFDIGRMAVVRDPGGAYFSMWQAMKHAGIGVWGEPGALCWADLNTQDRESAQKFYGALFGWKFDGGQQDYLHISRDGHHIGGMPSSQQLPPQMPAHWLPYFEVADADQTTSAAEGLGAQVHLKPMTLENVGRFAITADPQGATFAIFQNKGAK